MDLKDIKSLIEMLEASSVSKLQLKTNDVELKLEKESFHQLAHEQPSVVIAPSKTETHDEKITSGVQVLAPLVGTYYHASSPESEPYVTLGSEVKKGDTLCMIEAMKVLNEIKAPRDGKVVSIQVKNGDLVAYDQVLMEIGES